MINYIFLRNRLFTKGNRDEKNSDYKLVETFLTKGTEGKRTNHCGSQKYKTEYLVGRVN